MHETGHLFGFTVKREVYLPNSIEFRGKTYYPHPVECTNGLSMVWEFPDGFGSDIVIEFDSEGYASVYLNTERVYWINTAPYNECFVIEKIISFIEDEIVANGDLKVDEWMDVFTYDFDTDELI